ncbi:MAG TPA: sigma-70 family RNA polymerase sigma factor [Candidatus Baltobacteraceae bacterium]|jgi:RNA polymerase sigma-B factor|nr:sigma-70 family RNA polymerase sigma factor [Candidatus Baltobacteraceae bacterium]
MIALAQNDFEDRNSLVARYVYLCKRGARKFCRPGLDRADLEQVAAIGLIKAGDRYDAALQTPFEAYAWLFVVGELMHYVRDHERMVRAPRRLRSLERKYQHAHDELVAELGCEPTAQQIAHRLGVARSEVDEVRRYREQAMPQSLHGLHPGELFFHSYTMEDRENRVLLDAALARLTEIERIIVLAVYAKGYTQIELAERLGYSRRHVSRLHRAALNKMRPVWVHDTARLGT